MRLHSVLFLLFCPGLLVAEEIWPRWRGPHQDGHSHATDLPLQWSERDVAWKAELPGEGQSSPIVWGDRIFLTASRNRGAERLVFCLNRLDGEPLWERSVWKGDPEASHKMNGWASASCVTDGVRVYAFFGKGGLHAFTVAGEPLWSKELGDFPGPWGTAACPILVDDLLIQNCDADQGARLVAFDKITGEEKWSAPRHEYRGWSTPTLLVVSDQSGNSHRELILNGHTGPRGYDPATGEELWSVELGPGRGEPTVTPDADGKQLFVIPGKTPGLIFSVTPGGQGTVTQSHVNWVKTRGGGRDLPSPIVVGQYVMAISMTGILTCYDADRGAELWKTRVGGNFSASPVAWRGHALFLGENGETVVVKPGPEADIVHRNKLPASADEVFRASPTPCRGQVLIRSDRTLYCIAAGD